MKEFLRNKIITALKSIIEDFDESSSTYRIVIEKPRIAEHGDLTTNVAMVLAKKIGKPPRAFAENLISRLEIDKTYIKKIEIAGAGFINFFFTEKYFYERLKEIIQSGDRFGSSNIGKGLKTQIEFVSANPTGPLTVGHGRGAVLGDTIANLLEWTGHNVVREYYFNNAGRQMRVLGDSVRLRYLELLGETVDFPEDYYQGDYIKDIAQHIIEQYGDSLKNQTDIEFFKQQAEREIFEDIKKTLKRLDIEFDVFFNEKSLYDDGSVQDVVNTLKSKNLAYEKDGAIWFKATALGGESDKVIIKSTGEPTYRLPDIAYHRNKFQRGFELIIDILGADHIATYPDVLAGLKALGYDEKKVKVLIHQFVTILQNGEIVKMSTRKANFITLDELIDEAGADVVRYFFLMRSMDSHLNFDLNLAKNQSEENPVYYLQYAHARIASILRYAESEGLSLNESLNLELLDKPEEIQLIKQLEQFPDIVEMCAQSYQPHLLAEYLHDTAGFFHKFYHLYRVVSEDKLLSSARTALCIATKTVLKNGLRILGISAPEKM
ncbi:MAG: Arginyl-tRNA synthetase [Ignavibacteriae bacterium]|nr:MAG: Arginyl-tRNA synthetase [Ignavibacteriota bacterium]